MEKSWTIDNLFFSSDRGTLLSVFAGNIAEIIEFNGEYYIQKGDQTLSSKYIKNGDIIHLKQNAEMIFTLKDGSEAKIIGPAAFSVSKSKITWYKIILLEGNFFKIFNEKSENNLEIIADEISLFQDKNQPLDLQIAKEGTELMIKNSWGEIKVSTKKNNETIEKTIRPEEIAKIKNNDINILSDNAEFSQFLSKHNISETLSLLENKVLENNNEQIENMAQWPNMEEILPEMSEILKPQTPKEELPIENYEQIWSELGIGNNTKLPSKTQNEIIKNSLNTFFLMNNIEKIVKTTLENNEEKANESIKDLANKINSITSSFGFDKRADNTLSSIKEISLQVKSFLASQYYIAPSQLQQLETIANRCDYISTHIQKDWISSEQSQQERENLKSSLPANLKFN